MAQLTQPASSTQVVQQQVTAVKNGASYNPSGDQVYMAFVAVPSYGAAAAPASSSASWNAAAWETDSSPVAYWASCLVGPLNGGVSLTAGTYQIFVKITDSPEVPILAGWTLLLT